MSYTFEMPPQEGWVCPKCGRVYAPWKSMCEYCGGKTVTVADGTSGMPISEWGKSTTSSGESYTIHSSSSCDYPNNVCKNH